jgi:hypothetical protein
MTITHLCNRFDVYDLDANSIALEIAEDTPLGEAIRCIREGEPVDASTFMSLHNVGIDLDSLYESYS